ncbi:MAG: NADH-quinone oxidoreductase subunit L [Bacteroidetes bacterium]|nr:MAG: NADH-quinone oxidoreductase subunit L [Bacteroidota bacterium]REK06483.1 MAG: NADH-quinone oxidoreductase subunit L [Bacteroidota bacterium]REK33249.1 MAG: NADH-quinone oxidoreductase subunit L [Bacteroidota bacterium]REK47086.1 MAG: NADH-quinone oxidoreductase subunit L [Bacteroidota bacterium]
MNVLYLLLIPLLPFAGFLLTGLFGKAFRGSSAGLLNTTLLLISFLLSVKVVSDYFFIHGLLEDRYVPIIAFQLEWLRFSEDLVINMGVLMDPLTAVMLLVVTFISLMVHMYSIAYMKGEERFATYFSFLSLFTFSMLGLVMSSNIFQTYIFWELVGVSSFLLIGYYFQKPSAVAASKKAFIVTRFADLGFLIGILVLSYYGNSFDFLALSANLTSYDSSFHQAAIGAGFLGISALSWGLILVFMGGAGKSAMFPLHIWLPDAMEGPTPVSALIHAATMVVAGVFLVARMFALFALGGTNVLELVAWTGIISAMMAALIACTQQDIKRVLAYSTMSQIGFMMFAIGVSGYGSESGLGYTAGMFHLFTHAMFKALLFLGAGAVIHFVHSNYMDDMGGLRKMMPVTHITFLLACLAIAGIPPFAGFFSKEEILLASYNANRIIFWLALFTSGLTAFYMFRLYFSIFWKKEKAYQNHQGEGGGLLLTPLVILGILTVVSGFIPFGNFVSSDGVPVSPHLDLKFSILPVGLSLAGIIIASRLYMKESVLPEKLSARLGRIYKLLRGKFYIDEIYLFIAKKIIFRFISRPAAWVDRNIVDGLINTSAAATQLFSISTSGMQSGKLQHYAGYFLSGVLLLIVLFIFLLSN